MTSSINEATDGKNEKLSQPSVGEETREADTQPCCKVGKGIKHIGDERLNDKIVTRYSDDSVGLRDLETIFNSHLVSHMLSDLDGNVLEVLNRRETADPETLAEILHDDEGKTIAGVRKTLEKAGVDVEQLTSRFVTYRTIKNHLNNCLEVDTSREEAEPFSTNGAQAQIEWSASRHTDISKHSIERLAKFKDEIGSEVTVQTNTTVTCSSCGVEKPISSYLTDGCHCSAE